MKNTTDRLLAYIQLANTEAERLLTNTEVVNDMDVTEKNSLVVTRDAIAVALVGCTQLRKTLNLKGD